MLLDVAATLAVIGVLCGIIVQFLIYKKANEQAAFQQAKASAIMHNAIEVLQASGLQAVQELPHDEYQISYVPCAINEGILSHYKIVVSWKDLLHNDHIIEVLVSGGLSSAKERA